MNPKSMFDRPAPCAVRSFAAVSGPGATAQKERDRLGQALPAPGTTAATADKLPACKRRRVVIVERFLTHYRVAFYESLRSQMAARGIELILLVGEATSAEKSKRDAGMLPWAISLRTYYLFGPFGFRVNDSWSGTGDTTIAVDVENMLGPSNDPAAEKAKIIASWPREEQTRRRRFLEMINKWVAGLSTEPTSSRG